MLCKHIIQVMKISRIPKPLSKLFMNVLNQNRVDVVKNISFPFSLVSNSTPENLHKEETGLALPTQDNNGVYYLNGIGIFELRCSSESCKWTQKKQELSKDIKKSKSVAMYVSSAETNCK